MKQKLFYLICSALLLSCSSTEEDVGSATSKKTFDSKGIFEGDYKMTEKEATEVLMNFLEGNGNNSLKSSQSPVRIINCKETNTQAFSSGNMLKSASGENDESVPLYQFTISEKEDEYGFALVSGDKRLNEVLAYVPNGNIADTIYNEGLSDFLRSLSVITTTAIGNEYWQPEISGTVIPETYQFLKYATEQEYWDWPWYGNWDYWEHPCAFVPVKWDQEHPYNMNAKIEDGCTQRPRIGCGAVAVAQIMAYHKKPNNYDWNTLTCTEKITSSSSSFAQNEVARLMRDLADAVETDYIGCISGGTNANRIYWGFDKSGYSTSLKTESKKISTDTVYANIMKNNPVLCTVDKTTEHSGHAFVIDGLYRKYRDKYLFRKDISDPNNKIFEIYKVREFLAYLHINWGWGGDSDGWYYAIDPYNKPYMWFGVNKTLITNIRYTGQ